MKLNNGELLEKYNEIWDNVTVKKRSGSEPSYNGKYPRTRIKPYEGKINLILTDNEIPKEGSQGMFLSISNIN